MKPHRRAAARFIGSVRRGLQQALSEEAELNGLTQSQIARELDVHRSVISRELNGRADISLGRAAELAFLMNRRLRLHFEKIESPVGSNIATISEASRQTAETVNLRSGMMVAPTATNGSLVWSPHTGAASKSKMPA